MTENSGGVWLAGNVSGGYGGREGRQGRLTLFARREEVEALGEVVHGRETCAVRRAVVSCRGGAAVV